MVAGGKKALILCVLCVVGWLLLGMTVYKLAGNCSTVTSCSATGDLVESEVCGWTAQESFYYSVQAGFSIGFGLLPESNDGSRFYTVIHILLGSSIVGGILALFLSLAVEAHTSQRDKVESVLASYARKLHVDGYKGFTVAELLPLMVRFPKFYRDVLELADGVNADSEAKFDQYAQMTPEQRKPAAAALLERAHTQVPSLRDGKLSIDEIKAIRREETGGISRKIKLLLKSHAPVVLVWSAFLLWVTIGMIFGAAAEGWSFIQSLYFAISTCSTGGLQAVTRTDDGWHVLFAAFFALVGVPLYGSALGVFANVVAGRYTDKVHAEKVNERFKAEEVEFVEHINGESHSDTLDFGEYLTVQMLKMGNLDRGTLREMKEHFKRLDTNGTGKISKAALIEPNKRCIERIGASKAASASPPLEQSPPAQPPPAQAAAAAAGKEADDESTVNRL